MKTFNIVLILIVIFFNGCKNENRTITKDEKGTGNVQNTNSTESKLIFDKTQNELNKIVKMFTLEKNIFNIQRLDFKKTYTSEFNYKYETSYRISPTNNPGTRFFIPSDYQGNEDGYWKLNFSEIKSIDGINLDQFLETNNIADSLFINTRKFLSENNFFLITKVTGRKYILIYINIADGFIFNPTNYEKPILTEATEIIQFDKNWYYFREYK